MKRLLALAVVCVATTASAQAARTTPLPSLDIERLRLNPGAESSLLVPTGELLEVGQTRFTLAAQYVNGASLTRVGKNYASARLQDRATGHFGVAGAVHERVQLQLELPVVMHQSEAESLSSKGFAPVSPNGLGTIILGGRVALLRQSKGEAMNLSLGVSGGLPSGNASALAGDSVPPFIPSVSAGYDFGEFTVGATALLRMRTQENWQYRGVSPNELDTVRHEFGLGLTTAGKLADDLSGEVAVWLDLSTRELGATAQTFAGVRYQLAKNSQAFVGGGPAFGTLTGTPNFRLLSGISFDL